MLSLANVTERVSRLTVFLAVAALSTTVAACQAQPRGEEPAQGDVFMGNASPAPSPSTGDPAGEVHPFEAVREMDASGDLLAVRTAGELRVGSLDEILGGAARAYPLDDVCGDVSANNEAFAVGCGQEIRLFTRAGEDRVSIEGDVPVTAAAVTGGGEIVAASRDAKDIRVLRDGEVQRTFPAARETDRLLATSRSGKPDAVVRLNNTDTTIQDLDWQGSRQGGTLRAGLGVGGAATGPEGMVLAADATGSQLLVYNTEDIIRLQMTAPVAEHPWAVAWDTQANLAWITSTATNTAEGYTLATGVPVKKKSFATVPDAQSLIALPDGTIVAASASGKGIQVVSPN